MASIFQEGDGPSIFLLTPLEKGIYRFCGIHPEEEMTWQHYAKSLILFNFLGFIALFLILIFQGFLPLNPQGFAGVGFALAFNTAISFVTNTNWQAYAGETTLSYFTQMMGLTVQNFASAATGNAVLLAFIRGITRHSSKTIGNFWKDSVRTTVYLLLPFSFLFAFLLVGQGVIQNVDPYVKVSTVEHQTQTLPMGPVASQVAIKQLGTNGGGFFNANSAHPFENPTPFSNFLENFAILWIPIATIFMFGRMIKSFKDSLVLFFVKTSLFVLAFAISFYSQMHSNPNFEITPFLEGIETRFSSLKSLFWSISTTATSNGSVNMMLDSLSPLSGGIILFNMMLGEVIFGGVGVGMCGILMFVLLTVFLSGLMVGRTPEYLGKKIEKEEIQWTIVAILVPCALILFGSSLALSLPNALDSLGNQGPHGLSEILYAFASASANNGSAFSGLNANTHFFNIILGLTMLMGRLAIVIPSLAIAGHLADKKIIPPSIGTFSTQTFLFGILLFCVIVIVAGLTFFPALSLGPLMEHFLMLDGITF